MLKLNIHENIKEKLENFCINKKIPNIIFHGPFGSGKKTIVNEFIQRIYNNDKESIHNYVRNVNCAHGKGIKFVREELKFFAKMHIHSNGGNTFKSIILINGDKLTMDAQSAIRRCIETYTHNTRFFIIVENKSNLLKPILSRFCEIYVPEPEFNNRLIHLYSYNLENTFQSKKIKLKQMELLKKDFLNINDANNLSIIEIMNIAVKFYEKGYSGLDIIHLIEQYPDLLREKMDVLKKYELLIAFDKVRKELRSEKLLILFILNFIFLSSNVSLENMSFM
jgi:DNA polymerase III delta prime subunit